MYIREAEPGCNWYFRLAEPLSPTQGEGYEAGKDRVPNH